MSGYDPFGPPRIEIVVELENAPRCRLYATTVEDEKRLRIWLGRCGFRWLCRLVEDLPDDLDLRLLP